MARMKGKGGYSPGGHGNSEKEGARVGAGAFAGMPQEVSMKSYPKAHEYGSSDEDDTISRVDAEQGRMHSTARRHMSNQH
jgi:hypothetical protein